MNDETPIQTRPKMGRMWSLLLVAGIIGLFAYFANQRDWVTAIVVVTTGVAAFGGFRAGTIKIVAWLAAASGAMYFAPVLGIKFETTFSDWVGTQGLTNRFLTIAVVGLLIFVVASVVLIKVGRRLIHGHKRLTAMNHWFGFAIGATEGMLVMLIFFGGMLTIQQVTANRSIQGLQVSDRAKILTKILDTTTEQVNVSRIGPIIHTLNPFEHIPQLSNVDEMQRGMDVLLDPAKVNALIRQPAIRGLKNRADVSEALKQLNEDPDIKRLLDSDNPASKDLAIHLCNHPAVLQLLDKPEFRSEAMAAIRTTIMPQGKP